MGLIGYTTNIIHFFGFTKHFIKILIFMFMNLYESISRIKSIMYESVKDYEIVTYGDIKSPNGMIVCIITTDGKHIGETNIIDFENGLSLSPNLTKFMETNNDMFNQDNCVYQYSLNIDQPYQRQGWGEKLKHECHDIIKNLGYTYATNIVRHDNVRSQKLMNKLGYKKHQSNEERDILYLEL